MEPHSPESIQTDRKERLLKRLAWAWAVVFTLVAGFYLVENLRGQWARDRATARLAAAGESLDLTRFQPSKVLPSENFCATPALLRLEREWTASATASAPLKFLDRLDRMPLSRSPREREPIDWEAFRAEAPKGFPLLTAAEEPDAARAVARLFDPQEAFFAELAGAARTRPHAQFTPPLYDHDNRSGVMGGLRRNNPVGVLLNVVALKARVALATGDSGQSLDNLKVLWKLRQATMAEPWRWVGQVTSLRLDEHSACVVLDGLRTRAWTDGQLQEIQEELGRRDIQGEALQVVRWELADAWDFLDRLNGPGSAAYQDWTASLDPPFQRWFLRLAPRGWRYQTQAIAVHDSLDRQILPLRDSGIQEWYRRECDRRAQKESGPYPPIYYQLLLIGPWLPREWYARWVLFAKIEARQLQLACALERHRLQYAKYPDALSQLDPKYLSQIPADADGQPMRYALDSANQRYRLWSVGIDGRDDWQGKPPVPDSSAASGKSASTLQRRRPLPRPDEKADWVLLFP